MGNKKYILSLGILFVFAGLTFPQSANAGLLEEFANSFFNIFILTQIGWPVLLATGGAYALAVAGALLAQATTTIVSDLLSQMISIPVVPGKAIDIVTIGWAFSRSFVNMFFLLFFVFIGIATILRVQGYGIQKALPRLIVVILLVNFSGVVVGLIVDIGNLFTNFFISKIKDFNLIGPTLTALFPGALEDFFEIAKSINKNPLSFLMALSVPLAKAAILAAFFIVLLLILFIIVLIFLLRIVILWILVILAPFAFAFAIFPVTQRFFNMWRDQLVLWAIIGIPISFFLYLTTWLTSVAGSQKLTDVLGAQQGSGIEGILSTLLAPMVTLLTLIIGIGLSVTLAPQAAQGIIRLGQRLPGKARKTRIGKRMESGAARGAARAMRGVDRVQGAAFGMAFRGAKRGAQKIPGAQRVGGWGKQAAGKVGGAVEGAAQRVPGGTRAAAGAKKAARAAGRKAAGAAANAPKPPMTLGAIFGPMLLEHAARTDQISLPSGFRDWSDEEKISYVKTAGLVETELLQATAQMGDAWAKDPALKQRVLKAQSRYSDDAHYFAQNRIVASTSPEEQTEEVAINMAAAPKVTKEEKEKARASAREQIDEIFEDIESEVKVNPELIVQFNEELGITDAANPNEQDTIKLRNLAAARRQIRAMKPNDMSRIENADSFKMRYVLRDATPEQLQNLRSNVGGEDFRKIFSEEGGFNEAANSKESLKEFAVRNPDLVRALFQRNAFREIEWEGRNQIKSDADLEDLMREAQAEREHRRQQTSTRGTGGSRPSGGPQRPAGGQQQRGPKYTGGTGGATP